MSKSKELLELQNQRKNEEMDLRYREMLFFGRCPECLQVHGSNLNCDKCAQYGEEQFENEREN